MYPLLLKPVIKDYIWGGTKLRDEFGYETGEIAAEAWLLTSRSDASNIILNGEFKNKTITEVLSTWGSEALGKNALKFDRFPILIKFIDAKQSLSLQVHPDDTYALANEGEFGKTEMWYVVGAEKGSQLLCGLKNKVDKTYFAEMVNENNLTAVCNYIDVKKGDTVLIPAGTLHAIGAGLLIAEVQQNSDVTYRVSDYGRLGADGKPRELHLKKALNVIDFEATPPICKNWAEGSGNLVDTKIFISNILRLKGEKVIFNNDSFTSIIVLSGEGVLNSQNCEINFQKGDSIFIPAGLKAKIFGECEILESYV